MNGTSLFQSEIIVVSPLTTKAILGVDFLKEYEAQIDFSSGQLKFGGCNPLALNLRQGTMRGTGVGTVQSSETVKIPPFSEQVVMAELSGPVPNSVHFRTGSVHITGQFTDYSTADMWQMKAILDMFIFLSYCDACN